MKSFCKIIRQSSHLCVTWIVNNVCPYSCWYCLPSIYNGGVNRAYEWNQCEDFINKLLTRYGKVHFALSGGEPTQWPHIDNLMIKAKTLNGAITVGFTTNMIRSAKWWQLYCSDFAYVVASYHPDMLTTSDNRDEWLKKVEDVAKHTHVLVRLSMDPRHWEHCVDLYERWSQKNDLPFNVEPVRLINFNESDPSWFKYSDLQESWFINHAKLVRKKQKAYGSSAMHEYIEKNYIKYDDGSIEMLNHVSDLIRYKQNNFYDWECNIGLEHLFVNPDGWIKRGNCQQGGTLGNIKEIDKINFPTDPIVCKSTFCHCTTDIKISKKRR